MLPAAPPVPAELPAEALPAALAPALSLPALPPCPALSDAGRPALPAVPALVPAVGLPPTAGLALFPALGAALPALGGLVAPAVGPELLVCAPLAPARVLAEVVVLVPLAPALDASSTSGSERALPHASAPTINKSPAPRLGSAEAWRRDGATGCKRSSSNVGGADQVRGQTTTSHRAVSVAHASGSCEADHGWPGDVGSNRASSGRSAAISG